MMTIFGLNSPELFVLLVIALVILGTKRIEKGLYLLSRLLKFLLSNQNSIDKKAKEKESIKDKADTEKKEKEIIKTEEKPNAKEKESIKDKADTEKKEKEITKTEEKPNAKDKESIKDIGETQKKDYKSNKRLKIANVDKKEINSAKIKEKKGIEKDKTVKKLKTINVQAEQLEK